ncbi:MAG TPA: VOC family protein [Gammaproteobacteria bacterium]|nr:VOC family protein [Gammaproteobacteria bacterium]
MSDTGGSMWEDDEPDPLEAISAVTLAVTDMARSVRFYRRLGFRIRYGGEGASFTSFHVGPGFLNLQLVPDADIRPWGRPIFHVDDVDAMHRRAVTAGFMPHAEPRNAPWGERFFHLTDPDGHELSFARPL